MEESLTPHIAPRRKRVVILVLYGALFVAAIALAALVFYRSHTQTNLADTNGESERASMLSEDEILMRELESPRVEPDISDEELVREITSTHATDADHTNPPVKDLIRTLSSNGLE